MTEFIDNKFFWLKFNEGDSVPRLFIYRYFNQLDADLNRLERRLCNLLESSKDYDLELYNYNTHYTEHDLSYFDIKGRLSRSFIPFSQFNYLNSLLFERFFTDIEEYVGPVQEPIPVTNQDFLNSSGFYSR